MWIVERGTEPTFTPSATRSPEGFANMLIDPHGEDSRTTEKDGGESGQEAAQLEPSDEHEPHVKANKQDTGASYHSTNVSHHRRPSPPPQPPPLDADQSLDLKPHPTTPTSLFHQSLNTISEQSTRSPLPQERGSK